LGGSTIINHDFFSGNGLNFPNISYPSPATWLSALETQLDNLFSYGLDYIISGEQVTVYTLTCDGLNLNSEFKINVGIDFSITCV
jgi:hypothetical protein